MGSLWKSKEQKVEIRDKEKNKQKQDSAKQKLTAAYMMHEK